MDEEPCEGVGVARHREFAEDFGEVATEACDVVDAGVAGEADLGERLEGAAEPSVVESVVKSSAFKSALRSAGTVLGREITRSLFGTSRKR